MRLKKRFKSDPPIEKKIAFPGGLAVVYYIITQSLYISNINFVYLPMEAWEIELQNRIPVGIAVGWSFYNKDENHDYGEFVVYLGLISLHFKWQ